MTSAQHLSRLSLDESFDVFSESLELRLVELEKEAVDEADLWISIAEAREHINRLEFAEAAGVLAHIRSSCDARQGDGYLAEMEVERKIDELLDRALE